MLHDHDYTCVFFFVNYNPLVTTCRLPSECERKLTARGIACSPDNLARLAQFCASSVRPSAVPWAFSGTAAVPIPPGAVSTTVERSLVTWAMATATDWSWYQEPVNHGWRPEQHSILERVNRLRQDGIGLLEASTGIGKTRVFAYVAACLSDQVRVVIAVPTLAVAAQWRENWPRFSDEPLAEVWGKAHYGEDEKLATDAQTTALESAAQARVVMCTHQMIPKVLEHSAGNSLLLVDEAHLLSAAMASLAGTFFPASALGQWVQRWCDQQTLPGTEDEEIEVAGRMRELIIHRLVPKQEWRHAWRASIITRQGSEPLVWVRHANSVSEVLQRMWSRTARAVLFSGTLSWLSASGLRSTHHLARRLEIPAGRIQDMGRVRPAWRDEGVTVLRPARHTASDKKMWLGAYRGREEQWWPEVASALLAIRKRPGKSLILLNSYADVEGIRAAMGRVAGVVTSKKGESVSEGLKALARKGAWCWLATGAAWTGMDTSIDLQRVVVVKLPLPDPHAMRLLAHPHDAVFDAVCRFRQGVGRLVRSSGREGLEIIVLDGRINDPSARWKSICQPFMQILGDDFEHHAVLDFQPHAD